MATTVFQRRLTFFLRNVSVSGVKYLSLQHATIFGRLFWLMSLIMSGGGMIFILQLTITRYYSDLITIDVDTLFLHWDNTFPAVSICLTKGRSTTAKLKDYIRAANIPYSTTEVSFNRVIHSYTFMTPSNMQFSWKKECAGLNGTCGVDIDILRDQILPRSCKEFMYNVTYSGEQYDNCEDIFKFHRSRMGFCYLANNLMHGSPKLYFNMSSVDYLLQFFLITNDLWEFGIYVHSPEELPFHLLNYDQKPVKEAIRLMYGIEEIVNEEDVQYIPPITRGCRFPNEPISNNLKNYSFSNCMDEMLALEEITLCNCTTDLRFSTKSRVCAISDRDCLQEKKVIEQTRDRQSNFPSTCLPTCVEMKINEIGKDMKYYDEPNVRVGVEIIQPPFIRYRRRLSSNIMDLVVCVGGLAGLFFGASVINIVEFAYIWLIRRL